MSGTEARWGRPMKRVAETFGEDDREIPLSELWREKPTVLVFLRHFG